MLKTVFLFYFFFNILICNNNFKEEVFKKYYIQTINYQDSQYSIALLTSFNQSINYYISWLPTSNLIIHSKLMNSFKKDKNLFYAFSFGFLFNNKNIVGMSFNSLKYDNIFNNVNWNTYFLVNKIDYKKWNFDTSIAYNFNKDFSFIIITNYFQRKIYKDFDIGLGFNITKINKISIIPYLGVNFNL